MSEDKEDPMLPDFDTELELVVVEEKPKKASTFHEAFGEALPEFTIDWEYLKNLPKKKD